VQRRTASSDVGTLYARQGPVPGRVSQPLPIVSLMAFTVVDWNVNGFALRGQVELLAGLEWDVALLQEVTRESWPSFRELATAGGVAFDHLPALVGGGPRYASAVLVRPRTSLHRFGVLRDVPSPERAAFAAVELQGRRASVCSWAAPPGVSWAMPVRGGRSCGSLRGSKSDVAR
jgi:hypothetical protein